MVVKALPPLGVFPPLAHQGGWDETLLVVGPLAVIGFALWLANKRVMSQLSKRADEPPSGAGTAPRNDDRPDPHRDGGPDAPAGATDR